jgi:PAS domain S-box-containing protein
MEPTLLQQFLAVWQNAALLVLGVFAYSSLRAVLEHQPRLIRGGVEGLFGFALAVLCMSAPLRLSAGVQIDARNAIVALVTVFGGPLAAAITAVGATGYRLWLGGAGALGGAIGIAASFGVSLPFCYWLRARKMLPNYRHVAALALAVGVALLIGIFIQPRAVALEMWQWAGIAGLTVVPSSVFVLGAIMVRFERGRAAERRVAESEARLRSIIDNLPQPLSIKDRQDRFLLVNKAAERRIGLPAEELIGQEDKLITKPAQGFEPVFEIQQRVLRTGEPARTPPLPVSYDGQPFSFVYSSFPIRNADGGVDAIGTISTDVSELTEAREALERRRSILERQQRALIDIVRANVFMERSVTFADAVRTITEAAGEVMEVEYTHVFQIDEPSAVSRCVDEWMRSTGRHGRAPDADLRHYGKLLSDLDRDQVTAITDPMDARLEERRDVLVARNVQAGILAGIYLGTHMLGHVGFIHVGSARQWTVEEMAFARSIADLVALMLVTSQHREALASLDLVGDGIYVEREDGRVIYANRAALVLAGQPNTGTMSYDGASSFPRAPVSLETDRDLHEITWAQDGVFLDLELRRTRLPGGGIVTVIEDITNKMAAQRDRERLQIQLQQASKMEAIGQLAGGVAHDFNNLLGAVIGFARFLEQDLPAGSQERQFATRILSACSRGKELVSQILAFTRAHTVERKPIDLRAALRDSRDLLAGSLPATTRLAVHAGELPLVVEANETQLGQIIVNLCLNAHDAIAGQPGQIRVALSRVRPGNADYRRTHLVGGLDPARAYARLDVADSGGGIAAEILPRIFEPFFTTKERGRGTGLGLAVVHGLITAYEGACAVESNPGRGTRFSVYLPLTEVRKPRTHGERTGTDLRGRERLLIVDDEVDITDMLSIGLERLGYEVAALNDAAEALEAVREAPAAWDVVITDHLMPGMQGLSLAQELKALRADLMVILCTGLDNGVIGQTAKAQGIDAFFAKPVEPEQIAAAIRHRAGH